MKTIVLFSSVYLWIASKLFRDRKTDEHTFTLLVKPVKAHHHIVNSSMMFY